MTTLTKMTRPSATSNRARAHELLDQIMDLFERPADRSDGDDYSTHRLPLDVKNRDAFNRACRAGRDRHGNVIDPALVRVQNARKLKHGHGWACSRADWNARLPASPPKLSETAKAKAKAERKQRRAEKAQTRAKHLEPTPRLSDTTLDELGLVRLPKRSA